MHTSLISLTGRYSSLGKPANTQGDGRAELHKCRHLAFHANAMQRGWHSQMALPCALSIWKKVEAIMKPSASMSRLDMAR